MYLVMQDLPGLAIPEYPGCHNEAQPVPELDIPSPQASPSPAPPPAQTADNSFDPFNPPGEDPAWFPTISQEEQLVNARAKAIKPRENKRIAIISPDNGAELTPAEIKRIKGELLVKLLGCGELKPASAVMTSIAREHSGMHHESVS